MADRVCAPKKHVEFTPNPNQQFEVWRVTFRMKRA